MIKLEALRTFVAVAEAGNIKDAAEQLYRTQSAVSMTLKNLEEEVGGPLFETDRKSSLSALGAFMLETGRLQIDSYDRTVGRIRAYAQNKIGRLALASVPSVAAHLLPSLLPRFVETRPGVEIELFDLDSRNVGNFVESGQADLGIAGRPGSAGLLSFDLLFHDRFKVVCASESKLATRRRSLRWTDLTSTQLIRNGASESIVAPEYRQLSSGATLTVRNVTSLVALVRSGLGITLLPALATVDLPDGVKALELAEAGTLREVGLIRRNAATLNPVAAAFRDHLMAELPAQKMRLGLLQEDLNG